MLYPILESICKNLNSQDLFGFFCAHSVIRKLMIQIKDVRERITEIDLKRCNILLNEYLYRYIVKLAPNLEIFHAGQVGTSISPNKHFPRLDTLKIQLTREYNNPSIDINTTVVRLEVENLTGMDLSFLKLIDKFDNIKELVLLKSIITLNMIKEIKKYKLRSLSLLYCKEKLEKIDILDEIPSLKVLTIIDIKSNKQVLLKGVKRHFLRNKPHNLNTLNYLVYSENEKIMRFPIDFNFVLLNSVTVLFVSTENYNWNNFVDLYYMYPRNYNLTFREIRPMNASKKNIEYIRNMFGLIKIKRPDMNLVYQD